MKEKFTSYNSQEKGACQATWGSTRVSQEAEGAKGKHGQNNTVVSEGRNESGREATRSELELDSVNNFGRLWAMAEVSSCLVPGPG